LARTDETLGTGGRTPKIEERLPPIGGKVALTDAPRKNRGERIPKDEKDKQRVGQ
jgi:hypothetical protein